MPATSQLDRLISITTIGVLSCSSAARDLLKSFGCGMGHSIDCFRRRWCLVLAARPIGSSASCCAGWRGFCAPSSGPSLPRPRPPKSAQNDRSPVLHGRPLHLVAASRDVRLQPGTRFPALRIVVSEAGPQSVFDGRKGGWSQLGNTVPTIV